MHLEIPIKLKVLYTLISKMADNSKKKRDMARYLKKYETDVGPRVKQKYYAIHLQGEKASLWFTVNDDGTMDWGMGARSKKCDTSIYTDTDTLFCLKDRRIKVMNPANSKEIIEVPFDFQSACRMGLVKWSGEASTPDVKRFMELLIAEPKFLDDIIP